MFLDAGLISRMAGKTTAAFEKRPFSSPRPIFDPANPFLLYPLASQADKMWSMVEDGGEWFGKTLEDARFSGARAGFLDGLF